MKSLLRITHPDIAWHTASMMLHVFGAAALMSFILSMHWYLWIPDLICLGICFYSGYYFELGFRTRRFQEYRYGAPPPQTKPNECNDGCHYKPSSNYCYYGNCTDGSNCALENELENKPLFERRGRSDVLRKQAAAIGHDPDCAVMNGEGCNCSLDRISQ